MTLLTSYGWKISDAIELSKDTLPYRDFIQRSRGEFTVAKDQNIRLSSGCLVIVAPAIWRLAARW